MSVTLDKKRILVTRPKLQAGYLCELITANGGQVIAFPTIEIQPVKDPDKILVRSNALSEYDFIVFVSRNAVNMAFEHYLKPAGLPADLKVFAIGAGTAEVLYNLNIKDVIHAGVHADSETLLSFPEMQKETLDGKKALIIRGVGGREYLADNLRKRGASVDYAEVYERCLPEYDVKDSHKIWQDIKPDAIVITSNDGLTNLLRLTLETDQSQLFNTPLVLMSARSDSLAKESGFVSDTSIAINKSDEGLLLALLDLVGE
ncbi:MAG: uroporphyrinogen-III synthase [marine bacterium B5-7]|nr:MAG: uroporphyrinogen-III synthase [marine bacterium B5-7]